MIVGVGTDIVEVSRISAVLARHGERFLGRVLSAEERDELVTVKDLARFVAKRFAAKEAFSKAFGTGLRPPVQLDALSVRHDQLGRPYLGYSGELLAVMQAKGWSAHLSISDEKEYVIAFAVIEEIGLSNVYN